LTILQALDDPRAFGKYFQGPSWDGWKVFLAALFGLPMSEAQVALYRHHTGRTTPPSGPCRECWCLAGRRSGKSLIAALVSLYLSLFVDWTPHLAPGEVCSAMTVSPDRKQSRVILRFQKGFVRSVPMIARMVTGETRDGFEFSNRTICETQTADPATLRGYVAHLIINDEICFLPTESSAEPDSEILIAERPCLASLPGSLLLSISSPYARRGSMFEAYQAHYGKDGDPVLFWKGTSLEMNPTLDPAIVAAAYDLDPATAAAEYGAEWRSDCERLFSEEMLNKVTDFDLPSVVPYQESEVSS
jgi:hypothetical protein